VPFGLMRLLSGAAFSLGLILVIVDGAELFTGNHCCPAIFPRA
jgi:formate transporter